MVNKNKGLTVIMALAMLLPCFAMAGEGYGQMCQRLVRNTWNTSFPPVAQLGTLGATVILAEGTGSPIVLMGGLFGAPLLAHYLRSRQSPYLSAPTSWSSCINHPMIVQIAAIVAAYYLVSRHPVNDNFSATGLAKAVALGAVTSGLVNFWYNQ